MFGFGLLIGLSLGLIFNYYQTRRYVKNLNELTSRWKSVVGFWQTNYYSKCNTRYIENYRSKHLNN